MRKLTKRMAWRTLREYWERAEVIDGHPTVAIAGCYSTCLCNGIERMKTIGLISKAVCDQMHAEASARRYIWLSQFRWPRDEDGAKQRIEFCRKMEKKKSKKGAK